MGVALLLDDSEWVLQDLDDRLKRKGYVVHTSAATDQAEKIAKSETLDLVVVDLKLDYRSEFGGLDFIRFLKRNQPRTKVVVLSGHDESVVLDDFPRSDIDLWVSKTDPAGNYLDLVSNGIARFEAQAAKKRCFVIMPMSKSASCWKTEAGKDALKAGLQEARPRPVQPPPGCRRADLPPGNCTDFSVSPLQTDRNDAGCEGWELVPMVGQSMVGTVCMKRPSL